jgi:FMN reductase
MEQFHMTTKRIFGLSGSTSAHSKTTRLVEAIANRAGRRFDFSVEVADLNDFGPSLGAARRLDDLDPAARSLADRLVGADALVVASPVYKGSYTGLFKHLFDLLDPLALVGRPVLLAASGGGDRHALVIEHQLRPLLGFFEAATLPTGVYASERDFADAHLAAPLSERIDRAVGQFALVLDSGFAERAVPIFSADRASFALARL